MLTRDQAIAEIRAAKSDPERLATLALPDDPDVRRYLFDVCEIDALAQALFERTKDKNHWARFQINTFALGGMVLVSEDMCDWDRTRHEWALRPGWEGVEIWEEKTAGKDWAKKHYEAPRKALEAKESWLGGEIGDEELKEARKASSCAVNVFSYTASIFRAAAQAVHYASAVYPAADYAAYYVSYASVSYAAGRDRWYLDYLCFLLEACNKELLR